MSMLKSLKSMVYRGTIKRVNDGMQMQSLVVEGYANEEDDAEKFEAYGFTSNPPTGKDTEVICFRLGGEREHTIAIMGTLRGKRVKGKLPGTSIHYGFDGQAITCGPLGNITIVPTLAGTVKIGSEAAIVPASGIGDLVTATVGTAAWQQSVNASLAAIITKFSVPATVVPAPLAVAAPLGQIATGKEKVLIGP